MNIDELKLTPRRKEIVDRLDLRSSEEILSYYPFRYEEYLKTPYSEFVEGRQVCFYGELVSYPSIFRRGRLTTCRFQVLYEEEIITVTIFNRPWVRNLGMNQLITVIGRYEGKNRVTASNYYAKDISGSIIPYYPLKEGISQNDIKKIIEYTYGKCESQIRDILPVDIIAKHHLIDYKSAIYNIHFPSSKDKLAQAISRLKFEEFIRFYLTLEILKGYNSSVKPAKVFDRDKVDKFIESFGFEMTPDQAKACEDILNDLASERIMYRLVQGEVGSGKTAVAMVALYANYLAGMKGVLMAPTEILAKQHYASLCKAMEPFGLRVGILYSGMDDEKECKRKIADGEYDIIAGTHALFSQDVKYPDLGLVIADEQHRFGVKQRQALKEKGENADFILMSATPIPRTLASSIYGDMDISTIESMPSGRKGCKTYLIENNSIRDIMGEIRNKLDEGRQIYIIAAAIDKSDNYKAKDVYGLYDSLKDVLKPYEVALLHGKLSTVQKDEIMKGFAENRIQVLISTTVVEVGVNVQNATMMIIYDADRFGLAQLHQLRGRIQRGSHEGICYLLTDSKDEEVIRRLNILCQSNDGFEISYQDLLLRGPGDILGTRQSGLPAFVLGNLIEDKRFIEAARADVKMIMDNLDKKEYRDYYTQILEMADQKVIS